MKMLLKHEIDIKTIKKYYKNTLQITTHHDHEIIMQIFLKHEINVNV
jgi:hypothetical protein